MKRFLLTGLLLFGIGQISSFAQTGGSYTDDIYYSSEDAKKDAEAQKKKAAEEQARRQQAQQNEEQYTSSGKNYQSDGDYIDYDDDDYYYSNRLRRFNSPYWGMGYYSGFYDPYWGWGSPWFRPGFSVSVGWGNPYWGSCWGCYGWYGYPGFYNSFNNPYYAYGGWGGGYWNGYYDGFYNGYYTGAYGYGGYAPVRTATYGPRYSPGYGGLRSSSAGRTEPGLRRTAIENGQLRTAPRGENGNTVTSAPRGNAQAEEVRAVRGTNRFQTETPVRNNGVQMENNAAGDRNAVMQESRPSRSSRFFRSENAVAEQPRQTVERQPSVERSRSYSQPSRSYSQPSRSSSPSRSYSSPSRSSGGGGGFSRGGRR